MADSCEAVVTGIRADYRPGPDHLMARQKTIEAFLSGMLLKQLFCGEECLPFQRGAITHFNDALHRFLEAERIAIITSSAPVFLDMASISAMLPSTETP